MKNQNNGITLIALVITIIILLILAGISIASLTGSGLFEKAGEAKVKSEEAQADEDIKLVLNEWFILNNLNDITFTNFLELKTESKEIDEYEILENENIKIYRNDYYLIVDKKGNIVEEIQKSGPRPVISDISIKLENGIEPEDYTLESGTKLIIDFKASIKNGEITSINPTLPYETDGSEEVLFVIVGTVNGKEYTRTIKILLKDKYIKSYESLEKAVIEITEDGEKKIQIQAQEENVKHGINAIVYNEDLILNGTDNVKGATLEDRIYKFGDALRDVATKEEEAKNTVVLKVNGNIIINENVTLTTCNSDNGYGGPKGLIIYCTGEIINNGEISMTARGAKAQGQNVYLYKNENGTYEYIPKIGATRGI